MCNISQYTPGWLSDTAANKYVKTYFNSFVDISGGDLVVRGTGKIYNQKDNRIKHIQHVARLKCGSTNPKDRPMIPKDWSVSFKFELQENGMLNLATLKKMVEQGGILGLGTFRPIFGRFSVTWLD